MNAVHGTMLGLAIAMGGWACSAQDATIPIKQIERDAQLSARLAMPGEETASNASSSSFSSSSSSSRSLAPGTVPLEPFAAGFVRVPPVMVSRAIGSRYYLLNGIHLGMALFDVEMTQRCIASHTCREGNPIMPSSLAGQLGVNFALVGYGSFVSYRMKKHGSHLWWLSPTMGAAAHSAGAATGLAHQ
jgi:hypothetical protein